MAARDNQRAVFHALLTPQLAANVASVALSPFAMSNWSTRLADLADNWAHFRALSFRFRIHRGSLTGRLTVGFVGGVQDVTPATASNIMELLPATVYENTYTKPSDWVKVSKSELRGPFPWYKSLPGTADATEEAPGVLCIVGGAAADVTTIEVVGEFEFKTAVAPANTPMAVQLRGLALAERRNIAREAARQRMSAVLTGATNSPLPARLGGDVSTYVNAYPGANQASNRLTPGGP